MTATREVSEAIRAARERRARYNNPLPAAHVATACVWYGTTPAGVYRSDVIDLAGVVGFAEQCQADGWLALAVYEGVMPVAGVRNGRIWINELVMS